MIRVGVERHCLQLDNIEPLIHEQVHAKSGATVIKNNNGNVGINGLTESQYGLYHLLEIPKYVLNHIGHSLIYSKRNI